MEASEPLDIAVTEFCSERLFDPQKAGTTILCSTPEEFESDIREKWYELFWREQEGYAPFCKLVFMINWLDCVKSGAVPITKENQHLVKSGYFSRTDKELPVLSRWVETDEAPRAEYLVLVLYSKEQIDKESGSEDFDADWGVVAVLGQVHDSEEPMAPITMMRNALGTAEGGSGVPLDREAYQRSVDFWASHAVVKSPLTDIE